MEVSVYKSYEIPLDSEYVQEAARLQQLWREACKKAKGTGTKVGSIKNFTFAGFMIGLSREPRLSEEQKAKITTEMLNRMGDGKGKLDLGKAAKLDDVVAQASMTKGAKVGYVNIRTHEGHEDLAKMLDAVMCAIGKRQWDSRAPCPVAKELRKVAEKARGRGDAAGSS